MISNNNKKHEYIYYNTDNFHNNIRGYCNNNLYGFNKDQFGK